MAFWFKVSSAEMVPYVKAEKNVLFWGGGGG